MGIQAYVYNTESSAVSKIASVNTQEGLPSEAATTYCNHEFNNTKWIIKYSPNIGMDTVFGEQPIDFDYIDPQPDI